MSWIPDGFWWFHSNLGNCFSPGLFFVCQFRLLIEIDFAYSRIWRAILLEFWFLFGNFSMIARIAFKMSAVAALFKLSFPIFFS